MVDFRILGPVEAYCGERRVALGGPRQVALLAFLLLHANRSVQTDQLIDALWVDPDPAGAVKRVLVAVERLRRVLDAHRPGAAESLSRTVAGGYLLAVESDALDADVFRARVKEGRAAVSPASSEPARAVALLRAALGLWRGRALADVAQQSWAQADIATLEELRLTTLEDPHRDRPAALSPTMR